MLLSIIIPVFNEEESIKILYNQIQLELKDVVKEIIFINDGSSDDSKGIIQEIIANDNNVKLINLNSNISFNCSFVCNNSKYGFNRL